jgi:aspartate 1-decarboxylase
MQRQLLKSKIHRATVTGCDLHYVGSITIDTELMQQADLLPYEKVHVLNLANGARFETYTIEGRPGSGEIKINGAAAHLCSEGDRVIVLSYGIYSADDLDAYSPVVVHVDERNRIARVDSSPEVLLAGTTPAEDWSLPLGGEPGSGGLLG